MYFLAFTISFFQLSAKEAEQERELYGYRHNTEYQLACYHMEEFLKSY